MKPSASPSLFPQVASISFVFCKLSVSVLVGTDKPLAAGGVIVLEFFPFGSPGLGGFTGADGLLPDDRLSGVTPRLFDLLWNVFCCESFEPLLRLLLKGDRLLCVPLGLAGDLSM